MPRDSIDGRRTRGAEASSGAASPVFDAKVKKGDGELGEVDGDGRGGETAAKDRPRRFRGVEVSCGDGAVGLSMSESDQEGAIRGMHARARCKRDKLGC